MLTIYHNNMCGKSRQTLELIKNSGKEVEIVEYLKDIPSEKLLKEIIVKLGIRPEDLIRKGEPLFKEKFKGKSYSDEEWIKIMVENPILIERPIVVDGNKAIIGRPPEKVLEIL
jgi:arsenate reductase